MQYDAFQFDLTASIFVHNLQTYGNFVNDDKRTILKVLELWENHSAVLLNFVHISLFVHFT